jgi:Protein of unknown function (DUF4240)
MTEDDFWDIIERLDWDRTGDDEQVVEPAVVALSRRSVSDIRSFEDLLAVKLHALDRESHARQIGEESYRGPDHHFSPDTFLYARCCAVANGRALYQRVLTNPPLMPKDPEFESILYVAATAYDRKTGKQFDHVTAVSYETFTNEDGWQQAQ